MTKQEKFLYWFLIVITFGLILLYWKTKKVEVKKELSTKTKVDIDLKKLIKFLGGPENIHHVSSTHTKVKIDFLDRKNINIEKIKEINGVSGVFASSTYIQLIVGNQALAIQKTLSSF
jgi:phosphotransferase system IIB component